MAVSSAIDLTSSVVSRHHRRVAYIAFSIGDALGFAPEEKRAMVTAGVLHDIGVLSLKEMNRLLLFDSEDYRRHAELGYLFLSRCSLFRDAANIVRFHHLPWADSAGSVSAGVDVPMNSHLLHLADRVDILVSNERYVLDQVESITARIVQSSGSVFVPEFVEVFRGLAVKEFFWLDIVNPSIDQIIRSKVRLPVMELDIDSLENLSRMFTRIIDYKSPFTSTHSCGVAASAEALSEALGLSKRECKLMRVAGYLHDLGKLAVPGEILNKPDRLDRLETEIIKSHTYYTDRILNGINDLEVINTWASLHHERLDGSGFPFHYTADKIPFNSRIMAVADVFTALAEPRPYREGMKKEDILKTIRKMVDEEALDGDVVGKLVENYDKVNSSRTVLQEAALKEYHEILENIAEIRQ